MVPIRKAISSAGIILLHRNKLEGTEEALCMSTGLSSRSFSGKSLIPSVQKIEPPSQWSRIQFTFAHSPMQGLEKSGLVHIWGMMAGSPWLEGLWESTRVTLIPIASFSIFAWLDFLFCSCASLLQKSPPPSSPSPHTCASHTHGHRQVTGWEAGSERSPSQQVLQDYFDVMNKIANSIEAFRTNENYQCVTQLHFSFVCLSLEQNRFYK